VRGIEAKLRELELEDPANEAVAAQPAHAVSNFDLKRYMNVLERCAPMLEPVAVRRDTVLVWTTRRHVEPFDRHARSGGFTVADRDRRRECARPGDQITPDLVLMDARMPGISGFETCRPEAREAAVGPAVIFMTDCRRAST